MRCSLVLCQDGNSKCHFYLETVTGDIYLAKKKNLYFAFVDLQKAFDRVPRNVCWLSGN